MVLAVFGAMGMLLVISLMHMHKASAQLAAPHGQFQMLYNKWGTQDDNAHWGGVGSENYHTARYDKSGSNAHYHPRDSTSGDADAMEPAWWRPGPGANSEYTGHAMDGEIYDPPDVKIFKPFMMKEGRETQLYDLDGPSASDAPAASWAASGEGTTDWMLTHEGPLLAQQQEGLQDARQPERDTTAMQVKKAQQLSLQHWRKAHPVKHWVMPPQGKQAARVAPLARRPAFMRGSKAPDSILAKARLRSERMAAEAAAAKAKEGMKTASGNQLYAENVEYTQFSKLPKDKALHAYRKAMHLGASEKAREETKKAGAAAAKREQRTLHTAQQRKAAMKRERGMVHADDLDFIFGGPATPKPERKAVKSKAAAAKAPTKAADKSRHTARREAGTKDLDKQQVAAETARAEKRRQRQQNTAAMLKKAAKVNAAAGKRNVAKDADSATLVEASSRDTQQLRAAKTPSWITNPWQPVRKQ